MAQTGYTPIQLYRTTTAAAAPSSGNLVAGELAINIADADMALYSKNNTGTVKRLINNPAGLKYPIVDGTSGQAVTTDGAGNLTLTTIAQTYPGAGIPNSTGSAWGTSYTTSGTGTVVALATSATLTTPTVTGYTETVTAGGTVTTTKTIVISTGTVYTATLTASTACVFTMPTATAGTSFIMLLKQAATTGAGTATFTSVKWGTAGAPTITATVGKMDILTFVADGTNWYGSIAQGYTY